MRTSAFFACSFFVAFFVAEGLMIAQEGSASKKGWKPSIDEKSAEIIDRCIEAMGGELTPALQARLEELTKKREKNRDK